LIRSHALLHQASRGRDDAGRVVATFDDYEIVRELVLDVITEGVDATISNTVRETIAAVSELRETHPAGTSVSALARHLKLDKSAVSRRAKAAASRGYLRNEQKGRGPARYVLGDPLPEEIELLPTRQVLEGWTRTARSSGIRDAPLPADPTFRHYINDADDSGLLVADEQLVLADAASLIADGILAPVSDQLRWAPAPDQPGIPGIELGRLVPNEALCRYETHRPFDWRAHDGRLICSLCHPQSTRRDTFNVQGVLFEPSAFEPPRPRREPP
jgi:MarR family